MTTTTQRSGRSKVALLQAPAIAVSERTTTIVHSVLAVASLIALALSYAYITDAYNSSGHPVGYAKGQLAFNGDTIKSYYVPMKAMGTLDTYRWTQMIDFAFILSVIAVGVFAASRLVRAANLASRVGRIAALAGALLAIGAGFDVIENLVSFVMLASPEDFPNALALVYSSAAAIKFAAIGLGLVLLVGSVTALVGSNVKRRLQS